MANIRIASLGGVGENGKNMYIVEVDDQIFILDAGIKYPDIDMYGIDAVVPNIDYLIQNKDKIAGIFVSHGHEDNIGAIPFLLKSLKSRIYGTHFTISIIESLLESNNMDISKYKLFRINANKVMKFGKISVSFFSTTHSIPESIGISIATEDGAIVYCTDFNFGNPAEDSYETTFDKITDISKHKVLALMTESINASALNRVSNDSLLEHNFNSEVIHFHGRIFVGAFSTDLIRIQKIIDLATKLERRVAIRSINNERLIKVAMASNYLRIPEKYYVDLSKLTSEEIDELKDIVIIVTGFRFEPYFSLVKMATGTDELIKFKKNDKVVLVCPPVPGTERQTTNAINTLCQYGTYLVSYDKTILRSTHASPDDLKMVYAMLKPVYIMPIKGEYRHMYDQMQVALGNGYDRDHILLTDIGEVIHFKDGILDSEREIIPHGDLFVDGTSVGIVDQDVIQERSKLAEEGVIIVYAALDMRKRCLIGNVNLTYRGFTHSFSEEALTNSLGGVLESIIRNAFKKSVFKIDDVKESICKELENLAYRYTRHRPIIIPIINEV